MFVTHRTPRGNMISIGGNSNEVSVTVNDADVHDGICIDVDEGRSK